MARDFNGSTQYLSRAAPATGYPVSFGGWFNPDGFGGFMMALADTAGAENYLGMSLTAVSGTLNATARNGANFRIWTTTAGASTGVWQHLFVVFTDATTCIAYIDGVSTGAYSDTTNTTPAGIDSLSIGVLLRSSAVAFYDGKGAETAIWSVALSALDVASLAAGYCPLLVRPQSLVAYWPMFGRQGATLGEESWVGAFPLTDTADCPLADHPNRIIYPSRPRIIIPAAVAASTTYPQLERGIRGMNRGMNMGMAA